LQERLGAYWEVKNFGQARQALVKFDAKVLKKSIEYEPDLVIILIGLNDARRGYYDFAKNFTAYYKALINHYRKQEPAPQIWLCCYPLPLDSDIKPRIEGGINPLVRQIAEETGAVLIDLEDTVPNKADFFGKQGIYPSEHACKLMAREVHRVMMGKAESLPYKVGSWKDRFGPAWDRLFKEQRLY
jgi:lysophospholipase L1-like esterase